MKTPPVQAEGADDDGIKAGVVASEAKKATENVATVSYFKLYSQAEPFDYLLIAIGTIGAMGAGITMPLFTVVFGKLVNTYGGGPVTSSQINEIALDFVYLAIASLVASFFEFSFFCWSGVRQASKVRQKYLEAALCQDITYYDVQSTSGDVLTALNDDTLAFQNAIAEKVGNTIHHITTFFGGVVIAFVYGWQLTLVMLSLTPLLALAGIVLAQVMSRGGELMATAYGKAQVLCSQAVTNVRTVVSFGSEERIVEQYKESLVEPTTAAIRLGIAQGCAGGMLNGIVFCTYALAFWYGQRLTANNGYSGGDVMIVIFACIIGGFALGQAGPNFQYLAAGRVAGRRLFEVIERVPPINVHAPGIVPTKPTAGCITLTNVAFSYPARPDVPVFRSFNLVIEAGHEVALVGASGSGKSTVIQLIERFYDPAAGSVCLDGVDIRQLSLPWYRSQVGLVSQEPTLFATTIRENILLGKENATDEEMEAAARAANAHRFISLMPMGYYTQVGERGVQLSGGQKQRIAIARAILKNPRIMLLDEATSALDTRSERMVQAAIDKLAVGRTTVVVAHRLSTIRGANKIAVVQAGSVVEQGTHSELFARTDSVYHNLVRLQEMAHAVHDAAEGTSPAAGEAEAEAEAEEEEVATMVKASQRELEAGDSRRRSQSTRASMDAAPAARSAAELAEEVTAKKAKKGDEVELTEEEKKVKVGMGRLLALNRPEWGYLAVGMCAAAVLGAVMPLFALFISNLIGVFYPDVSDPLTADANRHHAKMLARNYCLAFLALGVGQLLFYTLQGFCFATMGSRLAERVRILLLRAILHQEIGWFDRDENTSGGITTRLASDAATVRGASGDVLGVLVQNIVTLVAGLLVAFTAGWKMTLVVLAVLPLIIFSSYMQMKFYIGGSSPGSDKFAKANQTAAEGIMALRTVASFGLEKKVASLYRSLLHEPFVRSQQYGNLQGLSFGVGQGIQFAFYALAFWYGGQLLKKGEMNLVDMMKVFMAILLSSMGASQAQMAFPDVAKGKVAVARVFAIVDRKSAIDSSFPAGKSPATVGGAIELRDVCFAYPSRPDVQVFNNFSLTIAPGQITALVGESGSGKSTIISLIERFYDPLSGQVFLDGVDLRDLNLRFLRACVGLVSQEPALFNGTILDNIKFGKPDATMDEVLAAAKAANALEFIERQPGQFGTLLGEGGGISLSGGQKQRIAIARAILKNPRVLLLDEATSALDSESERVVQMALDNIMVGRTSVVIAHRLTTVRNAHKIAVVQRGVVLEEGSHDELMTRGADGAYVQLARAQAGSH